MRIRDSSFCFEAAYVAHCMLLVAYTRAKHGGAVADVLWRHLLDPKDPAGFTAASRALHARTANATTFLAWVTANSALKNTPELSRALDDFASDVDALARKGVVG